MTKEGLTATSKVTRFAKNTKIFEEFRDKLHRNQRKQMEYLFNFCEINGGVSQEDNISELQYRNFLKMILLKQISEDFLSSYSLKVLI